MKTLQKLEANIFMPVCNQFVNRGCLSVHVSLYFPASMRGEIESRLMKQFSFFNLINYSILNITPICGTLDIRRHSGDSLRFFKN